MKNVLALLFVFLFSSFSSLAQNIGHIGTWIFVDDGQTIEVELDQDGYITFRSEDEVLGGKPHIDEEGTMVWTTFRVDYSTSPHTIVIINHMKEDDFVDSFEAPGLFEILDGGKKLKLMINFDDEIYPTEFNEEDTIVATRVE